MGDARRPDLPAGLPLRDRERAEPAALLAAPVRRRRRAGQRGRLRAGARRRLRRAQARRPEADRGRDRALPARQRPALRLRQRLHLAGPFPQRPRRVVPLERPAEARDGRAQLPPVPRVEPGRAGPWLRVAERGARRPRPDQAGDLGRVRRDEPADDCTRAQARAGRGRLAARHRRRSRLRRRRERGRHRRIDPGAALRRARPAARLRPVGRLGQLLRLPRRRRPARLPGRARPGRRDNAAGRERRPPDARGDRRRLPGRTDRLACNRPRRRRRGSFRRCGLHGDRPRAGRVIAPASSGPEPPRRESSGS